MKELNDRAAVGRACGNLGNTYYLLGNFKEAIQYHEEVIFLKNCLCIISLTNYYLCLEIENCSRIW
jgi:hypothetical protein